MLHDLLIGAGNTLLLFSVSWIFGGSAGILMSLFAFQNNIAARFLSLMGVLFSAVPTLVFLFWIHYPLQMLLGVVWPPFASAAITLSLFISFAFAEIVHSTLSQTDRRFYEVARVLGVSRTVYISKVLVPNATRNAFPRTLFLVVSSLHATMFASLIGYEEIFRMIQRINSQTLQPVQTYTIMAGTYAALCLPIYVLATKLSRELEKEDKDE